MVGLLRSEDLFKYRETLVGGLSILHSQSNSLKSLNLR